jgi:predicted transcriptional regulator
MSKTVTSQSDALTVNLKTPLLGRLERFAEEKELTKSQVVSMALKSFLAAEMAKTPAFWDAVYDRFDENGKL